MSESALAAREVTVQRPRVSIIVPAYNAHAFLATTVRSVLAQTYTGWEMIIVDDGSTDATPDIIRHFAAEDSRIRMVQQTNQKQASARNNGMRQARGEWLAFLDADDLWTPDKLQAQLEIVDRDPSVDVVTSHGFMYHEHSKTRAPYAWPVISGRRAGHELYPSQLLQNAIPNLSVLMKRALIDTVGFQDESEEIAGCEDHEYWLRLMRSGAVFYGVDRKLFIYRRHPDNFSSDPVRQAFRSALVRLKNFEPKMVDATVADAFGVNLLNTAGFLYDNGDRSGADVLWRRGRALGYSETVMQPIARFSTAVACVTAEAHDIVRRAVKSLSYNAYYHMRVRTARVHEDMHHAYVLRQLGDRLQASGPLNVDPMARIVIRNPLGRLVTGGMTIGASTHITIAEAASQLVTGKGVFIARFCNFNVLGRVTLGDDTLFNNYCSVNCHAEIAIGNHTWFGEGVRFYDHNHRYKGSGIPFVNQGFTMAKITIGSNVWVGANCVILQGVTIGDGAVIGANNVVYKSVAPNTRIMARSMDTVSLIEREPFAREP